MYLKLCQACLEIPLILLKVFVTPICCKIIFEYCISKKYDFFLYKYFLFQHFQLKLILLKIRPIKRMDQYSYHKDIIQEELKDFYMFLLI